MHVMVWKWGHAGVAAAGRRGVMQFFELVDEIPGNRERFDSCHSMGWVCQAPAENPFLADTPNALCTSTGNRIAPACELLVLYACGV